MRKYAVLIILLCLAVFAGLPVSLSAQEGQSLPEQAPAAVEGEKKVTAIEVRGNKSISTNTIISKMKTRQGSVYQENVASDDLKRLYLLGFFDEGTRIDTEEYKDGVKVIITVVERPVIEKITFTGIKRLQARVDKLKESLKSKEGQYLDYPTLSEDLREIQKLYEKIGYSQAKAEYKVELNKETNKVKIEFSVIEDKKIRISKIFVEGNDAFSDRRIHKIMKTKSAWLFNAGVLKEEVLKEDIERVKAFYQKDGFADVKAEYRITPHPKQANLIYVTVTLEEGRKYLVGDITIDGNKDISRKEILSKLAECTPGKVFSQQGLSGDVANIQSLYFDNGYVSAQVNETASFNAATERTDIAYYITENEIAYVDMIKIRGNVKTKDIVIRRELRIKPADKFDGEKLRRSKERLQNLGFFEEISYDTLDTASANKKDLIVEVKEAKTGTFSFGGGYSSVDDFVGFIEVEQKNFDWKNFPYFTGDGQNLKLRASFGTITDSYTLSFTEPWIFDYPVSFGFDLYKEERERESDIGYGYDEDITGGALRLGKEISEYVRANLRYRLDNIDITNITDNASSDLMSEYGENTISSMEFGLTFDNRDNIFDPIKGDLLSGTIEYAGGPFAGDKDFFKFFGRASHYIPLWRKSALELRGRLGLADAYGDSSALPIYERFFAGGAYTVRGYHERKLGPIDSVSEDPLGGESMFVGNIEYVYPVFDFIKMAVFYDTGNVWGKINDFASDGLKSSFGLGFRVKTPVGPIMLDYGIPLDKEPGEDDKGSGRFHFSMSHGF